MLPVARFLLLLLIFISGECFAQYKLEVGFIGVKDGNGKVIHGLTYPRDVDACLDTIHMLVDGTNGPFTVGITGQARVESVTGTAVPGEYSTIDVLVKILGPGTAFINLKAKSGGIEAAQMNINIMPAPVATALSKMSATSCDGQKTTYRAEVVNTSKFVTYAWLVNGVEAYRGDVDFTSVLKANDKVTFKVINHGACIDLADSITTTVPSFVPSTIPIVTVTPSENPLCGTNAATFTANTSIQGTGAAYQWQLNGKDVGDNALVYKITDLKSGDKVTCTAGNLNNCVLPVTSQPVTVKIGEVPTVKLAGNQTISYGNTVQLTPITTGNIVSYSWWPVDGLSDATIANPIASPITTTKYSLTVTGVDGCTARADVNVAVTLNIPNTFTPNGDGINEKWAIPGLANSADCRINVYNRLGSLVFQSKGYGKPWDGSANGRALPAGTYFYLVDNKGSKLSGNVTIIR